jgi:hypothetical protein
LRDRYDSDIGWLFTAPLPRWWVLACKLIHNLAAVRAETHPILKAIQSCTEVTGVNAS